MRYWHPFTQEAVQEVEKFAPESIVLLPLYPQFSTTTSESSFNAWIREMKNQGLTIPVNFIGCYPKEPGFIKAMQGLLAKELDQIDGPVRILFSAHGLPQKVVDDGDPYPVHVNLSVTEVMTAFPHQDYQICYQSKVGKLKWLEPSLNDEIERAAHDRVGVLIVPISFVSEHSETLVELDMDFAQRAQELNLPFYGRTPTVSCHPLFIQGLAEQVVRQIQGSQVSCNVCPPSYHKCWCRAHG
jgi:ferrochelatase